MSIFKDWQNEELVKFAYSIPSKELDIINTNSCLNKCLEEQIMNDNNRKNLEKETKNSPSILNDLREEKELKPVGLINLHAYLWSTDANDYLKGIIYCSSIFAKGQTGYFVNNKNNIIEKLEVVDVVYSSITEYNSYIKYNKHVDCYLSAEYVIGNDVYNVFFKKVEDSVTLPPHNLLSVS